MGEALQQSNALPAPLMDATCAALASATIPLVARVAEENRVTDLAVALSPSRLAVIRCVDRATPEDHAALATMLTEGDFMWAGLVYGEGEASGLSGLIESFHGDEADRLVAPLRELREACSESG